MAFATHRGFVHAGGSPYGLRGVPSACGFTGSGAHGGIAQLRRQQTWRRDRSRTRRREVCSARTMTAPAALMALALAALAAATPAGGAAPTAQGRSRALQGTNCVHLDESQTQLWLDRETTAFFAPVPDRRVRAVHPHHPDVAVARPHRPRLRGRHRRGAEGQRGERQTRRLAQRAAPRVALVPGDGPRRAGAAVGVLHARQRVGGRAVAVAAEYERAVRPAADVPSEAEVGRRRVRPGDVRHVGDGPLRPPVVLGADRPAGAHARAQRPRATLPARRALPAHRVCASRARYAGGASDPRRRRVDRHRGRRDDGGARARRGVHARRKAGETRRRGRRRTT